jgi:hypothetical protein
VAPASTRLAERPRCGVIRPRNARARV